MDMISLVPAVLYDVLTGLFVWVVTNPVTATLVLVLFWLRGQMRSIRRQGAAATAELAEIKAMLQRIATSYASELEAVQPPATPVGDDAA